MATALTSLVEARPLRDDVAMTGEITLTGEVLPIGGLKEKVLAAQRNGVKRIIAPALNAQDVDDIPEHLRKQLDFHFVDRIEDVLALALEAPKRKRRDRSAVAG
jgi:ATP-dependent Lon protease